MNQDKASELQPPNFSTMWADIQTHVGQRKKQLLARSIQIAWPLSVIGFIYWLANNSPEEYQGPIAVIGFILFPFALLYYLVMRRIFKIEQLIWVDSYFDGRNLNQIQSWRIAKKLFWQSFRFSLWLGITFFLLPLLILIFFIILSITFIVIISANSESSVNAMELTGIPIILLLLSPVFLVLYYNFYLRIKIRYAWFLFIDEYKPQGFSFKDLRKNMNVLNSLRKSEEYKKSLSVFLASDAAGFAIDYAANQGNKILSGLGRGGEAIGSVATPVAKESAKQTVQFSQIVSLYALYRYARWYAFKESQSVNPNIYALVESQNKV